ncbi:AEX-3 domain-containing protein [Pavlovales sp. CCMP2436]|nr:AEX-3 domain-containing protein [Pavlovales sp. CCMP2436]
MNRVPGFSPLAEYIAVIGPRAVDGPAKVLGVFPDVGSMDEHAVPLPAGLEIFVLPAGCACVRAASPPPPRLFMVVLAASSAKLFVYCLLVHEALLGRDDDATEQPSATPHAATTPLPRSQPHARDWAPRCVAIISRHASSSPARYLEALLAQLEKIPLAEPPSIRRGDRRKTRRARKALVQASGKGSNSHFDAPVPASCPPEAEPGRLVDHFLFRTLRQQLGGVLPPEVPLPIDGSRVLVSCGDRQLSLSIHPRIHPSVSTNPLSPRYPGLGDRLPPPAFHPAALLARAPAEALCVLLECLLCEMTVVLVSDSAAVLSAAAEALSALLRPFAWQGAYVPVLPESLVDIVWAPVPALVGVLGALFDESVAPDLGIHPAEEASSPGSNSRAGSSLSATLPLLPPLGEGEALLPLVVDLRAGRRLLHGHAPPARLPDRIRAAIATAARAFERAAPLRLVASDVLELPLPQGRRRGGEEGGAPVRSCALLQLLLEADGSARAAGLATVVAAQLEALLPGVRKWARGSLRQLTDGVFNAAAFAETLPAGPQRAFVRELSATQRGRLPLLPLLPCWGPRHRAGAAPARAEKRRAGGRRSMTQVGGERRGRSLALRILQQARQSRRGGRTRHWKGSCRPSGGVSSRPSPPQWSPSPPSPSPTAQTPAEALGKMDALNALATLATAVAASAAAAAALAMQPTALAQKEAAVAAGVCVQEEEEETVAASAGAAAATQTAPSRPWAA